MLPVSRPQPAFRAIDPAVLLLLLLPRLLLRVAHMLLPQLEVLQLLVDANGQVLQREEIYQRVWGYAMAHGDRSVDVFVRKLRQKLESRSPGWTYIHTHFGFGYRLSPERSQPFHQTATPS